MQKKKMMFDCHSFPHPGSAKLALRSVAGTRIEEPVMAGDFSGRPEFSLKQSCIESVVAFKPSRLLVWYLGASPPAQHLTRPRVPWPHPQVIRRTDATTAARDHVSGKRMRMRQNPKSGPVTVLEKPSSRIRASSWGAPHIGMGHMCLCHSLLHAPPTPCPCRQLPSSHPAHL